VVTHGSVDVAILRDAWALAGVPESTWRPRLDEVRRAMGSQVENNREDLRIDVLPGAREVLAYLRDRGAILGVATGNLAAIGVAKLSQCGLWEWFHFGGFSDAFETRADVFRAALEQARALTSPTASICVLGDTPADVQAAHANSLDIIAVATGIFSYDILAAENPTRCIHTLNDLLS
jgi:phosphoglycolate phosphatase-like HAD superfamily hydrolase